MNWVDIGMALLWLLGLALGLWHGLVRLVLPLAGLAGGIALANQHASTIGLWLFDSSEPGARAGAFALIVLTTLVVVSILSWLLSRLLSWLALGWVNRLLGAVVGLGLGVVASNFLLSAMASYTPLSSQLQGSSLAPLVAEHLPSFSSLLPSGWERLRSLLGK